MILQRLCELARREQLLLPAGQAKRTLDFVVRLDMDGNFRGFESLRDSKGRGQTRILPEPPVRTSGVNAGFLCDNSKYVLGAMPDEDLENSKTKERGLKCHAAFLERIQQASAETGSPSLQAVLSFLQALPETREAVLSSLQEHEWTGGEYVTFALASAPEELICEEPDIMAYQAALANEQDADGTMQARCLATGLVHPARRLHEKLKGIPGAKTSGANLVSFNLKASSSQGLDQGENAPVSVEATLLYAAAISWLTEKVAGRRYRYATKIGKESILLFWTHEKHEGLNFLANFMAATTADELQECLKSPFLGKSPSNIDTTGFYGMTLTGNAGRVAIKDWFEADISTVLSNMSEYYTDLQIGYSDARLPMFQIIKALDPPGTNTSVAPDLSRRLTLAAMKGGELPINLIPAAMTRIRLAGNDSGKVRTLCALIKATLNRSKTHSYRRTLTVTVDNNNHEPAYLTGRLFALLERLQGAALNDLNASIRDRYFGSASTNPAMVFPRLLRVSTHHAKKAAGAGIWLERLKGDVIGKLPSSGFPTTLTLAEQGVFAIGYYHQREEFFQKKKSQPETSDQENENVEKGT